MKTNTQSETNGRGLRFFTQASFAIAIFLALISLIMLLASFDKDRFENEKLLAKPDAILGLSGQSVLLLVAWLNLLVAGGLVLMRDLVIKAVLIFWLCSVNLAYWLGLLWLKVHVPYALIVLVSQKAGLTPKMTSHVWAFFLASSAAIGIAIVIAEWQRVKQMRMANFMQLYRKFREDGLPLNK